MERARWAAAALLLAALLTGCRGASLAPRPAPLRGARCARCGMRVEDARIAAELVTVRGARFYDDIGCLATDRPPDQAPRRLWVMGANGDWIAAETAFYASSAGSRTPMGYNFAAYPTEEAARRADREGRALLWDEVIRAARDLDRSRGVR